MLHVNGKGCEESTSDSDLEEWLKNGCERDKGFKVRVKKGVSNSIYGKGLSTGFVNRAVIFWW